MIPALWGLLICGFIAASKIVVFGPKESGKTTIVEKLCQQPQTQRYHEYELRANLSIVEVEGYDAVSSQVLAVQIQDAGLCMESVGLVLMLEDPLIEYSRILSTQQALSRLLPVPTSKILGLVTKSDVDEFAATDDRVRIFRQRGIKSIVVGSNTNREEILEAIGPFFNVETARPLSLPVLNTPFDQLISALSGWTQEQIRSTSISVSNSAFNFDGDDVSFTLYRREQETVLVNPSSKLMARIGSDGLEIRQELPFDLSISSDVQVLLSGDFGKISSNAPLAIFGRSKVDRISSSRIAVSEKSSIHVKDLECQELIVNGELVITSSALLGAVKVSGSLRYEPEEALKATVINNKGTIMSKDLDCQYLFNHANILVKSSIISERIVNQVHGNISASSLKVTDELPLDMNQGGVLPSPDAIYLVIGSVHSEKQRMAELFNLQSAWLDDNKKLDDRAILHRLSEPNIAFIDVLAHDAQFWLSNSSFQKTVNGIHQILASLGKESISGVLLFESLENDHSCARRTVSQAFGLLRLLGCSLQNQSTIMIFSDGHADAYHNSSYSEAARVFGNYHLQKSCSLADAGVTMATLQELPIETQAAPSLALDVPLYYEVHRPAYSAPAAALTNHGYINIDSGNATSTVNTGLIISSEASEGPLLNFGIFKSNTLLDSSFKNHGTILASRIDFKDATNFGVAIVSVLSGLENSRLHNHGNFFSIRSDIDIGYLSNSGSLKVRQKISSRTIDNSGMLIAKDVCAVSASNSRTLTAEQLVASQSIENRGAITLVGLETRNFNPSNDSILKTSSFASSSCTLLGDFKASSVSIYGDVIIDTPTLNIKEMHCTGTATINNPNAVISSLRCGQVTGQSAARSMVFTDAGQDIRLPASAIPLRIEITGAQSILHLDGNYFIDQLRVAHDTKVIVTGKVVLALNEDVHLANLHVDGKLTVKGGSSLLLGNFSTTSSSLVVAEGNGSVIVSARLSPASSTCNHAGELRCHDFATEGCNLTSTGFIRATNLIEIVSPTAAITGGLQAGSGWLIEGDSCTIRSLPHGPGYVRADTLILSVPVNNPQASLFVRNSYTGPGNNRLEVFEYHGSQSLELSSAQMHAISAPNCPQVALKGEGLVDMLQVPNASLRIDGNYSCRMIDGSWLEVYGSCTIDGDGPISVQSDTVIHGRLHAPQAWLSTRSISNYGIIIAKAVLAQYLLDFIQGSYTSVHGLQSTETTSWSPHGVLDVGYLDLPNAANFSPRLIYAAIIKAPICRFAPIQNGLVSVGPDSRHSESFVDCKEYVLPTVLINPTQAINPATFKRLYGCFPEHSPVSIRQTKFDLNTNLRLRDTFVQASTTCFPSDLSWDGSLKVKTGSDLNIERFCRWNGGSLVLKAPNMTVRGRLDLGKDLFADIDNRILIEKCQDHWIERVKENSTKRILCFWSSETNIRWIKMARSDMNSGEVHTGGNAQLHSNELALNAGNVVAGGDLMTQAEIFTAGANIDTCYERDVAKGGNFWGSRRDSYVRVSQQVQAPTMVAHGTKRFRFDQMAAEGTQLVSGDDIIGHVSGNATLSAVYSVIEGKRAIKSTKFGVTKCTQETIKSVAPCSVVSTNGVNALTVDGHLSSESTMWMAKDAIMIEAGSAVFSAAYAVCNRSIEYQGMQDPLMYVDGTVQQTMTQAIPNRLITTSADGGSVVSVKSVGGLDITAPEFDSDNVSIKSESGSVNIPKARNTFYSESESFSASLNFFGSSALRAAANNERGWGCKLLDEIPLLGALKGLAQAKGDQQLVCAGINTAIATVGTLMELSSCAGIGDYLMNRLMRVELALTHTKEEQSVLQEIGMVMSRVKSSLRVEAIDDVRIGGLSGQLDSLFIKGKNVAFDPLVTKSRFSASSVSAGLSFNFGSITPGVSASAAESYGHSTVFSNPDLFVRSLGIQADEEVQIGTLIKAISSFVETKRLVIKSHKNESESSCWNASVSFGMGSKTVVGGSFGFGGSFVEELHVTGIESETMHVKASDSIQLHGAVLRLTESAESVQGSDGRSYYRFALPDSLSVFSASGSCVPDKAAAISTLRDWARNIVQNVQIWTEGQGQYVTTDFLSVDGASTAVNILLSQGPNGIEASLLNEQPGVIESRFIKSSDVVTKQRESYIGLGMSDIMACATCAGYLSVDYQKLIRTATNHSYIGTSFETGRTEFQDDRLARTETERVHSKTTRKIDISLKGIPIVTDFEKYFECFTKKPETLMEREEEMRYESACLYSEEPNHQELESLLKAILDESNKKSMHMREQDEAELLSLLPEYYLEETDDGQPLTRMLKILRKSNIPETARSGYEGNLLELGLVDGLMTGRALATAKFLRATEAERDVTQLNFDYTNRDTPMLWTLKKLIDAAEFSESFLRPLQYIKSKFIVGHMIIRYGPNLALVGRKPTGKTLISFSKVLTKKAANGLRKLMITDPFRELVFEKAAEVVTDRILNIPQECQDEFEREQLERRVNNAVHIYWDWYKLVADPKDLKNDIKATYKIIDKYTRKSLTAISKKGFGPWLRKQLSIEDLKKRAERFYVPLINRSKMDIADFKKNPKKWVKKHKKMFVDEFMNGMPLSDERTRAVLDLLMDQYAFPSDTSSVIRRTER